jgi:hypothetical protein
MKRLLLLVVSLLLSVMAFAQLEVREGSFKEVQGFVNINAEKMYDDNERPYAVLKIKTENIDSKQRRELKFGGDAQTFFETEYKDGEVWLYISYYATFLKISHEDLSSTEFWFPFDMEPKKGYELTLVNKPSVDEDLLRRIENLENASAALITEQTIEKPIDKPKEKPIEKPIEKVGYITVKSTPKGAWVLVDNKIVGVTPYLSESLVVGKHKITARLEGYEDDAKRVEIKEGEEVSIEFVLVSENVDNQEIITGKESKNHIVKEGAFSVSSNKSVYFARGNLQYNDSTNTSRFAEHQWDIAEGGWTDLFEWGYNNYKQWYALTKDEWVYLFDNRNTNSGIRFAKAIVNGVSGVVLLPDSWNISYYGLNNTNDKGALYSSNKISQRDWERRLEPKGAVFLPAAGYRNEHVFRVGTAGRYWSATEKSGNEAYGIGFTTNDLITVYSENRKHGCSVRLVRDAK